MSGEGSASLGTRAADTTSLADRLARSFHVVMAGIGVTALITLAVFAFVAYGLRPRVNRFVQGAKSVRNAQLAMNIAANGGRENHASRPLQEPGVA